MAQDIEKVIDLLNNMQRSNAENADSFDRLLTNIGSKLDMADNSTNTELMKAYLDELVKSVDDKYSFTLNKFEDIERAIKAVYDSQGESVKNSDMKELFDVFSKNINNLYTEARQEKAILAGIETKIADIASNKTDKEDILRTISLLRNDLGNVNMSYKSTIDDINTTLKSVLAGIKSVDPLKTGDTAKAQVDIIYKAVNEIIANLQSIEEREVNLEKVLENVSTSEDLKLIKGIIDSIFDKASEIDEKINSNAQKDDIDEIQLAIDKLNQRAVMNVSKEDFSQIQDQTDEILSQADEIKQILGKVALDIERVPDADDLERSITELYSQINTLAQNINTSDSSENFSEIASKIENFEEELEIIRNIVMDLNEALSSKVLTTLDSVSGANEELKEIITDTFKRIPQKEDIEQLLKNSQIIEEINTKTDDITKQLEVLPEIKENVEEVALRLPNMDVSEELSNIYDKTNSIENWLINSNIKENSQKIASQIEHNSTSDEIAQIQDTANEIISVLEKLSQSYDIEQISANMSEIRTQLGEIKNILGVSSTEREQSEIYEKLSDLERSISEIVSRSEFDVFIEDLKSCISSLSASTGSCSENIAQMQQIRKDIELKLSELDFSKTGDSLEGEFELLHERIKDLQSDITSIADFVKNNSGADYDYIKSELEAIKSMIEANSSDFDNISDIKNPDADSVKEYLCEVKNLLQDNPKGGLYSKLLSLEDSIVNNQTFNESAFSQIIDKINCINIEKEETESNSQIEQAISEIVSLKSQIKNLIQAFEQKDIENIDNPEGIYISNIENFISEKLTEIASNIDEITKTSDSKISEGFAYQTELIEQKTSQLQKLMSDIELNSGIDNPHFNEKLSGANETLGDFKQELQLVSTDITENISKKTSEILDGIKPIKEILDKVYKNLDTNVLRTEVSNLNTELTDSFELNDISSDLEDLYGRLTEKFAENENNLKDFILTDTDSIIIKLDNLKDYVEKSLDAIVPPDAGDMAEFQNFVKEINDFRESQNNLIFKSVEEIKQEIKQQSDEIKSMLSVANNHEEIISAIEELKKSFKSKSKKKSKGEEQEETVVYSDTGLDDLKSDFEKYSKEIEQLSADNAQITKVLQEISERLDSVINDVVNKASVSAGDEIDDFDDVTEDDIFGTDKFDFVQAFDILQQDIRNLSDKVENVKKDSENKEVSKIPSINNSGVVMSINSKVDEVLKALNNNWLSDVEKYIKTNNISLNSKLDSIESKLDVFVSDSTNTDILNEVSETLTGINDSVADIAPAIEDVVIPKIDELTPKIAEIAPKIEALTPVIEEKLSESDKKLSSMLEEVNDKITQIGADDGSLEELNNIKTLIGEQKTYIEDLEPNEKLEAFKKCLDEISFEVNALAADSNADSEKLSKTIKEMKESLMSAVVTIFDQVSFIEETEDIKDFVEERTDEINKNIAQITKQLHQMTSSDETSDYRYSMQDIETDLAKLRLALQDSQQVDLTEITDKLHSITSSVDSLTQDEMKELKSEISNLKEQTEFLIATSDKSYNALNNGIEGFGEIINDSITGKVDKLSKMLETSAQSDSVVRQALIYIGEWIDSATSSINKISVNSDEISRINEVLNGIEDLKTSIKTQVDNVIEEKFSLWNAQIKSLEKQFTKVEKLESQLVNQQERIDRLEMNIDKLLSIVENLDDPGLTRKMDKIEKQLSKLGTNVEKLASYVD